MTSDPASQGRQTGRRRRARRDGFTWSHDASTEVRSPLTRDGIVAAAIRVADAEGLDGLSMRRLGQELGSGATTLYWHVRNKDELEDLMVDVLIGEVMDDVAPAEGWRDELTEVARALRRVLLRHHRIASLLGERPTLGPRALDAADHVMGILRRAGFDDRTTSLATGSLINFATGFAVFESRAPGGSSDSAEGQAMVATIAEYFASLPPERHPHLLAVARVTVSEDDQFEYGVARLLDGIEADLGRPSPSGTEPSEPGRDGDGDDDRRPGDLNAMLLR